MSNNHHFSKDILIDTYNTRGWQHLVTLCKELGYEIKDSKSIIFTHEINSTREEYNNLLEKVREKVNNE